MGFRWDGCCVVVVWELFPDGRTLRRGQLKRWKQLSYAPSIISSSSVYDLVGIILS